MPAVTKERQTARAFGETIPFESLEKPGTYYSRWSGHLLRVPDEVLNGGHSPVIEILGTEPMLVTKLSANPFLPLNKARMIAADLDLEVNF